jgi:osmotically inducible protein OsmC
MAVTSKAKAAWKGTLKEGRGQVEFTHFKGDYTFASRFETGKGTNPEELIAAGHAACFSMQLSGLLTGNATPPKEIHTTAEVTIQAGVGITSIVLTTEATVPGITEEAFQEIAKTACDICPVSRALAGVKDISLNATLTN